MTGVELEFVRGLNQRGVRVEARAGRLIVDAPRGVLTLEDRKALQAQKPGILRLLARRCEAERLVCFACHDHRFWRSVSGVVICGVCHPPATDDLVAEWIEEGHAR